MAFTYIQILTLCKSKPVMSQARRIMKCIKTLFRGARNKCSKKKLSRNEHIKAKRLICKIAGVFFSQHKPCNMDGSGHMSYLSCLYLEYRICLEYSLPRLFKPRKCHFVMTCVIDACHICHGRMSGFICSMAR
jgi:hypothetical protein